MLYDNALLIELMAEAQHKVDALPTGRMFRARTEETVTWLLREMKSVEDNDWAFVSAYDADSEGVEGKFYVWALDDIRSVLNEDADRFAKAYDISDGGNWEGHNILNRSHAKDAFTDQDEEAFLTPARAKLYDIRAKRVWPSRDDKVLADWNGMTIAALCKAAAVYDHPEWVTAAQTAYDFILAKMVPEPGRLWHSWCDGRPAHPATLDDYSNMSRGALFLFEATGASKYLEQAKTWMETVETHFADPEDGGYYLAADDTPHLITRNKTHHDNATPAGNGITCDVLARLYHLTGDPDYRKRAEHLIKGIAGKETQDRVHQTTLLAGYELLETAIQIVVVGSDGAALTQAARCLGHPLAVINHIPTEQALPPTHPAHGKGPIDGQATAYVCVGTTCSLPITDPVTLRNALQQ